MAGVLLVVAWPAQANAQPTFVVERTLWVSGTGTAEENCNTLRSALESIPDPRTISNAYLVKVGPGAYNCGTDTVIVPLWVAVEGAGYSVTYIFGSRESSSVGVVSFAQGLGLAELRSLRVHNVLDTTSSGNIAVSVLNAIVRLENVGLAALNLSGSGVALWVGSSSGFNGTVRVWNSEITGNLAVKTEVIDNDQSEARFRSTLLSGLVDTTAGGSVNCAASWNGTLVLLDSACLPPPP